MARSEARLLTEVWEDRDFLALTDTAQRLFMFLLSQPDLAHSGVIALRERRWSRKCSNQGTGDVERDLKDLEAGRFIVVDWDSEELLVRSLIRRDRIFKQPNVMRAAVDNVPLIESQVIIRALTVEIDRIRRESTDLTTNQADVLNDMEKALAERVTTDPEPSPVQPARNPSENPSGKGSDIPPANPSAEVPGVRGDVQTVSKYFPDSPLIPPPAGDADAPAAPPSRALTLVPGDAVITITDLQNTRELIAYWIERCNQRPPGQVIGHMSNTIKRLVEDDGIAPRFISAGLDDFLTKDVSPSVLPSLVNTAMNRRPGRPAFEAPASNAPVRIAPEQRCPEHRDQRAGACRHCAARAKAGMR